MKEEEVMNMVHKGLPSLLIMRIEQGLTWLSFWLIRERPFVLAFCLSSKGTLISIFLVILSLARYVLDLFASSEPHTN